MAQYGTWGGGTSPGQASATSYFGDYNNLPPTSSDYPQNGIQGYSYSPQSPNKRNSATGYPEAYAPPSPSPSGQSGRSRITSWFRSRSNSHGDNRSRSRSRSKTPVESFVVRSVVKQAGGVHVADFEGWNEPSAAEGGSPYQRSKSKPLTGGMAMSLGVPPGGPGGGTGYGTAQSSNDGRPDEQMRETLPPMPMASSSSQGSYDNHGHTAFAPPPRPASPGVAKASVFQKPRRLSGSPAPAAWIQSPGRGGLDRPTSPIGERYVSSAYTGPAGNQTSLAHSESGPRPYLYDPSVNASTSAHDIPGFDPSTFQHGCEADAAHISFTASPTPGHRDGVDGHSAGNWNLFNSSKGNPIGTTSPTRGQAGASATSSPLRLITNNFSTTNPAPGSPSNATSPASGPGLASKLRGFFNSRTRLDGEEEEEDDHGADSGREDEGRGGRHDGTPYGVSPQILGTPRKGGVQPPPISPQTQRRMDAADWEAEQLRRQTQREAVRLIDEERRRAMDGALTSSPSPPEPPEKENTNLIPNPRSRHEKVPSLPSSLARELAEEGWTSDALAQMTESGRRDLVRRLTAKGKARSERTSQSAEESHDWNGQDNATQNRAETRDVEIEWEKLTPAQRIIAETRARQLAAEGASAAQALTPSTSSESTIQKAGQVQPATASGPKDAERVADETFEVPIRRSTRGRSPRKKAVPIKDGSQDQESSTAVNAASTSAPTNAEGSPIRPQAPRANTQLTTTTASSNKVGISPGHGPLPSQMGLLQGMEEMMVRFYRFERYAVPLLRAMDSRLGDIEKDAMISSNPSGSAPRSGDGEMDRWVGEMTRLMKHEIGQLKAAGKELREGRHILASILEIEKTKKQDQSSPNSVDTCATPVVASEKRSVSPARKESVQPVSTVRSLSPPKKETENAPHDRGRSTSPAGGRPKYTSALGRPLVDGRVSASVSPERPQSVAITPTTSTQHLIALQRAKSTAATVGSLERSASPVRQTLAPPPADASFSIDAAEDEDDEDDSQSDKGEPGVADASFSLEAAEDEDEDEDEDVSGDSIPSTAQATVNHKPSIPSSVDRDTSTAPLSPGRRDVSVSDRLKGLMQKTSSRPTNAEVSPVISDNGTIGASTLRSKAPSVSSTHTVTTYRAAPIGTSTTTSRPSSPNKMTSLAPPSSSGQSSTLPMLGGRTSPSPGGLIATRNLDGRYRTSPTNGSTASFRPNVGSSSSTSTSPKLIPDVRGDEIFIRGSNGGPGSGFSTGSRAGGSGMGGEGLRARAQSYLLSVSSTSENSPSPPLRSSPRMNSSGGKNTRPSSPRKGENIPTFGSSSSSSSSADAPYKNKSQYSNGNSNDIAPLNLTHKSTFSMAILPGPNSVSSSNTQRSAGAGNPSTTRMSLKERVAFFEVSSNRM